VALLLTKLDYGSATLAGLPGVQLDRLQSVLNAAERLIYRCRKFDHVIQLLKQLHWLRVPEQITFQLAVLSYRHQHNMAPRYLTAQLQQASNVGYRQHLHSLSLAKLDVPLIEHMTIGGRAFSSTGARVWNSLPTAVQSSESLDIFRRRLKTELIRAFLQLRPHLSNNFTAPWLTFTFLQLFAVAAALKSIDYNVAIAFILNLIF